MSDGSGQDVGGVHGGTERSLGGGQGCYDRKENIRRGSSEWLRQKQQLQLQPGSSTDLSPDEVELGVTLHTSGTLETGGQQGVTHGSCRSTPTSAGFQWFGNKRKLTGHLQELQA